MAARDVEFYGGSCSGLGVFWGGLVFFAKLFYVWVFFFGDCFYLLSSDDGCAQRQRIFIVDRDFHDQFIFQPKKQRIEQKRKDLLPGHQRKRHNRKKTRLPIRRIQLIYIRRLVDQLAIIPPKPFPNIRRQQFLIPYGNSPILLRTPMMNHDNYDNDEDHYFGYQVVFEEVEDWLQGWVGFCEG